MEQREGAQTLPLVLPPDMEPEHKLHIRNMVCDRCRSAVHGILEAEGIAFTHVKLGEVDLRRALSGAQRMRLTERLFEIGFELIDDKRVRMVERAKLLLQQHVLGNAMQRRKEKLSAWLAREMGMEYSGLSRIFSQVEATSIERYLNLLRLERAKELLVYDELSLTEIADRLGYSSVQHLSNQFAQFVGHSPSHFKRIGAERRKALDKVGKKETERTQSAMGMLAFITGSLLAMPCAVWAQAGCDSALQVAFTYPVEGFTIFLTDQSTNQLSDVHYYWIYGDDVVDHLGSGTHTYADPGTYQVCLSVSGSTGTDTCSAQHCETVLITGGSSSSNGFAVGPVPFSEAVYLYGAACDATFTLFDADGRMVWQGTPAVEVGRLRVEPAPLPPGAYSGLLTTAAGEQRFRLVKGER